MPWKKTIQPFRVSITKEQRHRLRQGFHLENCIPMCLTTESDQLNYGWVCHSGV
ncbi:hypothetical protein SLEP1_g51911 [Rubroshorea leprosula]|uniref:Uncharacterized protein n=1 Tax=Rubroshorea leprosula TaxID=152421 RepID=A0AAV5M815_9ROSI|nr:hypothetical protein SLEP1_g51911 [Rubroshorea leprosula]